MRFLSQSVLRTAVCLTLVSVSFAVNAQTEAEAVADTTVTAKKFRPKKKEPVYEMRTVKGRVSDASTHNPMGGVRVQALGNSRYSALTEEDGTFSVEVPVFVAALYVYAPEYAPLQEAIKDGVALDIRLLSDKLKAFYTDGTTITSQAKYNVNTSSAVTIVSDIQNNLAGDVHSINNNNMPGMGAFMNIHGINSLNAGTQPLVILDGNIIDTQWGRTSLHEGFHHDVLAGIDPETIESVQVLKNATALYGAKAANGAIIITTKRGRSMATKINANIFAGVEFVPTTQKMMNASQYRTYLSDLIATSGRYAGSANVSNLSGLVGEFAFLNENPSYPYYKIFHNETNWSDELYRSAWTQNYKINVEGGDERGMYALQLGYTKANSTARGNDFDRLSLRFNTDINIFSTLFAGIDISYNQTSYDLLDQGWSSDYSLHNIGSPNVLGLIQTPFISPYAYSRDPRTGVLSLTGEYAGKYASDPDYASDKMANPFHFTKEIAENVSLRHPYWIISNGEGKNKNYAEMSQMGINFSPRWEITKDWTLSDRFNYTMYRTSERYFLPRNGANTYALEDLGDIHSVMKSLFSKETIINNDLRVDWKKTFGAHNVHAFAGWRLNKFSYSNTNVRGYNNENDKLPQLKSTMSYINYDGTNDNWMDLTAYISGQYNYANRFFADFALSMMSSSRFGKETKDGVKLFGVSWGLFPSIQLGWVMSNEKWFNTNKWGIDYLKLTAGFDMSGNDEVDHYAARTYYESQLLGKNTVGLVLKNIANSNIQWETTYRYNVGLEASFIKNRLNIGLDLYWNRTANLLMRVAPNYLTGLASGWTNDGEMTNRGFDFRANAVLINHRNFKWQIGASIGHYRNEITKLPSSYKMTMGKETINGYTASVYGTDNIVNAVGYAMGQFYGYRTNGIFTTTAEAEAANLRYDTGNSSLRYFKAGDVRFVDQNGDGVINEADKVVIGNPHPDIYGNISTSFVYRRLRLDVLFKYSLGNQVFNYQRSQIEAGSNLYNQSAYMAYRWRSEGQQTDIPRAVYTDSEEWVNNERFSDRWIEDGSYLKLKNVRLTYECPWHTTWLQGMKIWAEANNLVTLTRYMGNDPESTNSSTVYQGIDTGLIPCGRSVNFGLSINF